jgi:hypothetical protein
LRASGAFSGPPPRSGAILAPPAAAAEYKASTCALVTHAQAAGAGASCRVLGPFRGRQRRVPRRKARGPPPDGPIIIRTADRRALNGTLYLPTPKRASTVVTEGRCRGIAGRAHPLPQSGGRLLRGAGGRVRPLRTIPQRRFGSSRKGRSGGYLSSDAKCNTPRRFDIGKVVQDLKECCHAILFAYVGGRKRPDRRFAGRGAVDRGRCPGARSGENHHLQGAAAEQPGT